MLVEERYGKVEVASAFVADLQELTAEERNDELAKTTMKKTTLLDQRGGKVEVAAAFAVQLEDLVTVEVRSEERGDGRAGDPTETREGAEKNSPVDGTVVATEAKPKTLGAEEQKRQWPKHRFKVAFEDSIRALKKSDDASEEGSKKRRGKKWSFQWKKGKSTDQGRKSDLSPKHQDDDDTLCELEDRILGNDADSSSDLMNQKNDKEETKATPRKDTGATTMLALAEELFSPGSSKSKSPAQKETKRASTVEGQGDKSADSKPGIHHKRLSNERQVPSIANAISKQESIDVSKEQMCHDVGKVADEKDPAFKKPLKEDKSHESLPTITLGTQSYNTKGIDGLPTKSIDNIGANSADVSNYFIKAYTKKETNKKMQIDLKTGNKAEASPISRRLSFTRKKKEKHESAKSGKSKWNVKLTVDTKATTRDEEGLITSPYHQESINQKATLLEEDKLLTSPALIGRTPAYHSQEHSASREVPQDSDSTKNVKQSMGFLVSPPVIANRMTLRPPTNKKASFTELFEQITGASKGSQVQPESNRVTDCSRSSNDVDSGSNGTQSGDSGKEDCDECAKNKTTDLQTCGPECNTPELLTQEPIKEAMEGVHFSKNIKGASLDEKKLEKTSSLTSEVTGESDVLGDLWYLICDPEDDYNPFHQRAESQDNLPPGVLPAMACGNSELDQGLKFAFSHVSSDISGLSHKAEQKKHSGFLRVMFGEQCIFSGMADVQNKQEICEKWETQEPETCETGQKTTTTEISHPVQPPKIMKQETGTTIGHPEEQEKEWEAIEMTLSQSHA
jgi:hypothetical protein